MTNETIRTHAPMDVQPETHINAPVNAFGWCFGLIPANGNWLDDIIDWHKRQFRQAAVARRMAACWNACRPISTEDLERYFGAGVGIDDAKTMKRTRHVASMYDGICAALGAARLTCEKPEQHPDDIAIDGFAAAMKKKMAKQRSKGYDGWEDTLRCPTIRLQHMLVEHVAKGDPVDVGNLAMMLFIRGVGTTLAVSDAALDTMVDRETLAQPAICEHDWPEAEGNTDLDGVCTKCRMSFQHYIHMEMP